MSNHYGSTIPTLLEMIQIEIDDKSITEKEVQHKKYAKPLNRSRTKQEIKLSNDEKPFGEIYKNEVVKVSVEITSKHDH